MKRPRPLTRPPRWKNTNDSGAQPACDLRNFGFARVLRRRGIRELSHDIAAQPLAQALSEFANQTGLQVVYVSEIAATQASKARPAGWRLLMRSSACWRVPGCASSS